MASSRRPNGNGTTSWGVCSVTPVSAGDRVDYVSICSPNYVHDAHIRLALRCGAHVLCEKPLVINPWNLDAIGDLERESGRRVSTVLQLRLHPELIALRDRLAGAKT